jgi:hypothetical protein
MPFAQAGTRFLTSNFQPDGGEYMQPDGAQQAREAVIGEED